MTAVSPRSPLSSPSAAILAGSIILSIAMVTAVVVRTAAGRPAAPPYLIEATGTTNYSLDQVAVNGETKFVVSQPLPHRLSLSSHDSLSLAGWAVDAQAKRPASAVFVQVDDATRITCAYGGKRPDVAAVLAEPADVSSGFVCSLAPGLFAPGDHDVALGIVSAGGTELYLERQQLVVRAAR